MLGTREQVTVQGWFANPAAQVAAFVSSDSLKLDTQLSTLVHAMAVYAGAHSGFNPQTTGIAMPADTALAAAVTAAWHH